MKGQFFLLGAILLAILFFIGMPLFTPLITNPSEDLPFLSNNLKNEFPVAFNLGLNQSNEEAILTNFTHFVNATLYDKLVNFTGLWVLARNTSASVNLTVGNFMGNTTINFSTGSTTIHLYVQANHSNSTTLPSPGSIYNLSIVFQEKNFTTEWLRDKANLYLFYHLTRGEDEIQEEFTA